MIRTCSGMSPISSCSSRYIACSGVSPRSMPPCGNCQEWVRIRTHSWQFPQGGIDRGETPEQAMYRELHEEIGLMPEHVRIIARTRDWLRYEVPERYIRRDARG